MTTHKNTDWKDKTCERCIYRDGEHCTHIQIPYLLVVAKPEGYDNACAEYSEDSYND